MTRLTNNAETGLSDGTAVTLANSDDGTPSAGTQLSAISTAGGALTYSTTAPRKGALCYRQVVGASGNAYLRFATGLAGTTMAGRVYILLESGASFSGNNTIVRATNAAAAAMLQLRLTSAGVPVFLNGGGTVVATGGAALSADTWYRLEFWVTPGTTTSTGRCSIDLYAGEDTSSSLLHYDSTAANNGTATTPRTIEVGRSGTAAGTYTLRTDDLASDDGIGETYIGPDVTSGAFQSDAVAASSFAPLANPIGAFQSDALSATSLAALAIRTGAFTVPAVSASSMAPLVKPNAAFTAPAVSASSFTPSDPNAAFAAPAVSAASFAPLAKPNGAFTSAAAAASSMAPLAKRVGAMTVAALSTSAMAPLAKRVGAFASAAGTVVSFAPVIPPHATTVYYRGTLIDRAYHLGEQVTLR